MSSQPKTRLTAVDYLAIERKAEFKSDFFDGEMFAMAGASLRHNQVVSNIIREVGTALKDGPCQVFPSDLRLKISKTGLYTYPDAIIVCGKQEFDDTQFDTLINPTVVFEVLSESTESYDRGTKSRHYRQIESLQAYVLISQDRPSVEVFTRTNENDWLLREATDLASEIELDSAKVNLVMSEIYRNVNFEPAEENPE